MPSIKRWFPVSHDINADPEVWAMRHQLGEKSLSIWLEFLSIADRNEGKLPGDIDELIRSVSSKCQSTVIKVRGVYDFAVTRMWLKCESPVKVSNFAKYHRTRVPNEHPSEPSEPSEPLKNHKNDSRQPVLADTLALLHKTATLTKKLGKQIELALTPKDFVDSWNENFAGYLPAVQWPLNHGRQHKLLCRLREHNSTDYWQRVFDNIAHSDFLLGRKSDWRCTFDFLINNDTNVNKIFEGQYNGAKVTSKS